ncbi:MAG: UMP kinase [Desulfobulbaceae bacterium]|nr:UMP kinase [Desulfobulbaceae bacterium]
MQSQYKRVLLKLSGEALMGKASYGICNDTMQFVSNEVKKLVDTGVQIGLVVGAGNIFRGVSGASQGMNRVSADNMGMLATVMNSLALDNFFSQAGIKTRVLSSIPMPLVCESYSRQQAVHHLDKGRVVIFAAGSSNPFFTTDTAAVLRGLEIGAEIICKATRVDGVYDSDPLKNPAAVKFDTLTYADVLARRLKVMDATAISLAMENNIQIMVFNMNISGNIANAVCGKPVGTIIKG